MSQNILFQQDQSYHSKVAQQHPFGTFEDLYSNSREKTTNKKQKIKTVKNGEDFTS